jgi:hypothetical protein
MGSETAATSPALNGDGNKSSGSDNLSLDRAAAMLRFVPELPKAESQTATEEVAPATPAAETTQAPVAEEATAPSPEAATAETATTPEATTEEATDPVLSNSTSLTPEQEAGIAKRIGREVAKSKAIKEQYEAKLAALEAKVAGLVAAPVTQPEVVAPVVPNSANPLANVNDVQSLMKLREDALNAIDFVEETLENPAAWQDNPNGSDAKVTIIGDKAYTEADLRASKRQAKATIDRQIPARLQFLSQKNAADQQAFKRFPFLTDKTSPEYQMAQQALRENSWLHGLPNATEIIGYQILGRKAEAERLAAAQAAPVEKPKPKVISAKPSNDQAAVSSNGAPTRTPGSGERSALAAFKAKLDAKGAITADDATRLMLLSEQAKRSR